jgi:hypothetical protein
MWVASGPDCETVRSAAKQVIIKGGYISSVAGRVDDRVLRRRPVRRFLILSRDYADCRPDCLHNRSSRAEGCGGESPRDIIYMVPSLPVDQRLNDHWFLVLPAHQRSRLY